MADINEYFQEVDFSQLITTPFANIFNNSLREWCNADKADELLAAANNYNPQEVITSINLKISDLEIWYTDFHNKIIIKIAEDENY